MPNGKLQIIYINVFWHLSVLFVVLTLLCGCGGYGPGNEDGAVLRVGNGAEVENLDPHLVTGVSEHRVLSALFEGLARLDLKTMKAVPAVAESWTVSPDTLQYEFRLRKTAKWSNGDPVTAQDFVYSWQRMLSPNLAAEYAYLLHCLKNAKAFHRGEISDFSKVGVQAVDAYTLQVTLEYPTPYFLAMQTHNAWFPVHRETVEQFGAMDERDTPWTRPGVMVSNGPFALAEWLPNEILQVSRNIHYWNADHVKLDGISFYPIDNLQTEERSFRSGRLHMTQDIPLDKVAVYRKKQPEVLQIHPYCGVYFYRLNVTRPPFDDVRVRRAFSMALDRQALTQSVMKGGEAPAFYFTPPDTAGYTCNHKVSFSPEKARALLAEAGYPQAQGLPPIEILYNTSDSHKRIAETIQRMWKKHLNADVRLLNQDWKVYLSSMNTLDYNVARSSWVADVDAPINFLECFLSTSGNNRTGWKSTEYDTLIAQAYQQGDLAQRYVILQQAEALLLQEQPIIPIYFYTRKFLKAICVEGYTPNALGLICWTDLSLADPTKADSKG